MYVFADLFTNRFYWRKRVVQSTFIIEYEVVHVQSHLSYLQNVFSCFKIQNVFVENSFT